MNKTHTFEISDAFCASVMCTALEGGIGYWCVADKMKLTPAENGTLDYVSFEAYDTESPGDLFGTVTYDTIRNGVRRLLTPDQGHTHSGIISALAMDLFMGPDHWGNIDADAADVIVQVGLFNELVYG